MRTEPPIDLMGFEDDYDDHWFGPFESGDYDVYSGGRWEIAWPNLGILIEEAKEACRRSQSKQGAEVAK